MEARTHWVFDNFFAEAPMMRQRIDDHFNDEIARKTPFARRAIWNYWFIDQLYTYLRTDPANIFPALYQRFLSHLRGFLAREYGLGTTGGLLSMYVSGCGQGIHNDARNGRLAYVFSLTRWDKKRFDGGETLLYKFDEASQQAARFLPTAGTGFYHRIEALFNRLLIFDDRVPHAVRPIQGPMNPADARFVIHGHIEETGRIEYVEGGLSQADLEKPWRQVNAAAAAMLKAHGQHGFITFELSLTPTGAARALAKHVQLHPVLAQAQTAKQCIDDAAEIISKADWPLAPAPSRLVFALCSGPLERA